MKIFALLSPETDGTEPDEFGQRDRLAARKAVGLPADADMKTVLMKHVSGMYDALQKDDLKRSAWEVSSMLESGLWLALKSVHVGLPPCVS